MSVRTFECEWEVRWFRGGERDISVEGGCETRHRAEEECYAWPGGEGRVVVCVVGVRRLGVCDVRG